MIYLFSGFKDVKTVDTDIKGLVGNVKVKCVFLLCVCVCDRERQPETQIENNLLLFCI